MTDWPWIPESDDVEMTPYTFDTLLQTNIGLLRNTSIMARIALDGAHRRSTSASGSYPLPFRC